MARTNPTDAEIRAFDKEIQEGQTFANRYKQGSSAPGERQIRIVDKKAGNVFTFVTTAHGNDSIVGRSGVMTTERLLRNFEKGRRLMAQLSDEFYAILKPSRRYGPAVNGVRPVNEFRVDKIRRGKPYTDADEVAVRLVITLDSSIFDEIIPTVNVTLGAKDLFINTEVEVEPIEADRYEQTGE